MLRIDAFKKARARKQSGFVITGELLLIGVVLVIGLVTGMTKLRDQSIAELSDMGDAIGAINNSYTVDGTKWTDSTGGLIAETSGFAFDDAADFASTTAVGGDGQFVTYNYAPHASTSADPSGENGNR